MSLSADNSGGLAAAWLAAVREPAVAAELEAVYVVIADQIEARRPRCEASGRCCNFRAWDHRLYTTGLEAAYTVSRLDTAGRAGLRAEEIDAAEARGDCPFLVGTSCGVHAIKPSGCRVYFCDPTAQDWQRELSEKSLAMIRALHDRRGIEYRYGEWRGLLRMFAG